MSTSRASVRIRRATWRAVLVLFAWGLPFSASAFAQSAFTHIHKFYSGPRAPNGRLVEAPDGSLYGTTLCGGGPAGCRGGTIFALRPQPPGRLVFEDLHHLRPGLHGVSPSGGLTLGSDGHLYGIATAEGLPLPEISTAAIFRLSSSGSLARLHAFGVQEPGVGGEDPTGRLAEASDGNFYGSTCASGRFGPLSSIFRMTPAGALTTIHTFRSSDPGNPGGFNPVDGFCPITELHEGGDGLLYGTAVAGGQPLPQLPQFPPLGTLFRLDYLTSPASLTVLHTFRGLDGAFPTGGLIAGSSGDFFGTTFAGGLFGRGVVYRLDSSGAVRTVHTFWGPDGALPFGRLFRSPNNALYGTTLAGGFGHGTLFRLDQSGFATLHWFTGQDGSRPVEMMQARDGYLYGVTTTGGPRGGGTIYRLSTANALETIHTFAAEPNAPQGGVIQASDGNFYGTTTEGRLGGGTVFRLTPSGAFTVLHDFEPLTGAAAHASSARPRGLIEGDDGFLYGWTSYDGAHKAGTIFRIAKTGGLTVLHSFVDCCGSVGLLKGTDGNLYGGTVASADVPPVIFRVEPTGRVSTVYSLGLSGVTSLAGMFAEGADGALYGIGSGPGFFNVGGLFKVTKTGTFTALYSFNSSSEVGYAPGYGLIRSSDGGLYGSTSLGLFSPPSIFRFDPKTNSIAVVAHAFVGGPLFEARDGTIYGRTGSNHSPLPPPRWFRVVGGTVEYFYDMVEADGLDPSEVIQGADGALYGTVSSGFFDRSRPETWAADVFAGGVFRLAPPPVSSVVPR